MYIFYLAGSSSSSEFLAACPLVFCRGKSVHAANGELFLSLDKNILHLQGQ